MRTIHKGSWSITGVCVVLGFMMAIQFRTTADMRASVPYQRVEELSERLLQTEKERDGLKDEIKLLKENNAGGGMSIASKEAELTAGTTALEGPGVVVVLNDSSAPSKAGENPNLYIVHDDDLLRVINELRAAGAEAIAINGQRLIGTSEIRCAGPTLSVNNVRSAPPYEIRAIGEKQALENSLQMRGGVAETLKVWGIQLEVTTMDKIYVPPYKGTVKQEYAKTVKEQKEKEARVK